MPATIIRLLIYVCSVAILFGQNPNTAAYPSAIATDETLLVASDRAVTTLSTSITATATSIPVVLATRFTPPMVVTIGGEQIKVCAKSGNTLTVCTGGRGFAGTTASAATSGTTVSGNVVANHINQLSAEVKAVQAALGPNFSGSGHVHSGAAITSGVIDPARLGTGTANSTTYLRGDGTWSAAAGGGAVSSVFGRTGAVTATAGDYTTAQVTESGNLYYTDARARAAITGTAPVSVAAGVVSCPTCVVTSGSYADPAWVTSISGSKVSGAVSSATALATARTIAGVSFDGTANIAIPSTGLSDTANLARLNATQSYSAGAKQTFTPSATTAGLNVGVRASAPSTPAQGDVYFDSTLTRKGVYDGTQWRYELYAPTGTGVMQWNGSVITAGALAYSSLTGTPSLAAIATSGSASDLTTGTVATARLGTGTANSTTYLRGDGTWATPAGSGSVTSVSTTTGLLSVSNPTTTPSIDITGTSGGIPYFSTTSTLASSAALDAGALVVGGGAGAAPSILANSSVPNAGELRISTAPAASATRSVMTLGNAIVGGASTGTYYAANAPSGNQSDLLNLQVNNASVFRVGYLGTLAMSAGITINRSSLTDVLNSNSGASAGLRITGSNGTGSGNQLTLRGTSGGTNSDQLRINGDAKAVMIGQTVATTGLSSMSLYVSDTTASTGVTRLSIQEGAGQGSTNGFEYRLNSGTANGGTLVWSISAGGEPTWGSTSEGTCSSTLRGQVVMVQGGAGVKDTFRICAKDAADTYAWRTLY